MKIKSTDMPCPFHKAFAIICVFSLALAVMPACSDGSPPTAPPEMTPIKPGPGEIHTDTLVKTGPRPKVKLRRNKDGTYSWEISGDDVDAILDADTRLKEHTGKSGKRKAD